jgi:hypothetical protein
VDDAENQRRYVQAIYSINLRYVVLVPNKFMPYTNSEAANDPAPPPADGEAR